MAPLELAAYAGVLRAMTPVVACKQCGSILGANPAGAVTFLFCSVTLELSANRSAIVAVVLTFVFRALTITLNWRTAPVASGSIFENDEAPPPGKR